MTKVLTHRGLEPQNPDFYFESSFEAFSSHLERGYGLEFDVANLKDGIGIIHDYDLNRLTKGKDARLLSELTQKDFQTLPLSKGRTCLAEELFSLIIEKGQSSSALHLKGRYQQDEKFLQKLISLLKNFPKLEKKIFIFDTTIKTAKLLKQALPNIELGISLVHAYDQKRFNQFTYNTLYTLKEMQTVPDLYQWCVLDEWDLNDENNQKKTILTHDFILQTQKKTMVISPELHFSSPSLYANEAHPSGGDKDQLESLWKQLKHWKVDLICTDFPDEVKKLL